jgi:hypothetical protein
MNKDLQKNLPVIIAFVLPLILILGVVLSAYVPALFLKTDYNFVYASCADNTYDYDCYNNIAKRFSIKNGQLVLNTLTPKENTSFTTEDLNNDFPARIYLHNTKDNESREITIEEAQSLQLNGLSTSPDGVSVGQRSNNRIEVFPLFYSSRNNSWYLRKGGKSKKLHLPDTNNTNYYSFNYHFIGWVLPGRTTN